MALQKNGLRIEAASAFQRPGDARHARRTAPADPRSAPARPTICDSAIDVIRPAVGPGTAILPLLTAW